MKKIITVVLVLVSFSIYGFADSFTDAVQDLGFYAACIGTYSATEAGGGWDNDPHDYYTPQGIASRLAKESGNQTKTNTFYGICFNYAEAAYNYVNSHKSRFNSKGMYENQYFVAGVLDNPNQIELMDIVTKDKSTRMQNGVPIKTYAHYENTRAHNSATFHAWIWIRRADGIWFWVDPTWTDNLGYVVYGYVENGQEIQCRPDSKYCINNPDHLDKLPLPPTMGNRLPQSPTAYSTDRKEVLKYTGTDWIDEAFNKIFVDVDYSNFDEWATIMASTSVPFSALFDEEESFSIDKITFGIDLFTSFESTAVGMGLEYLRNYKEENNINGALLNFYLPRRLTNWAAWYAGGGIGLRFDFSEDWASPKSGGNHWYSNLPGTGWFAFKIDTGVLINLSHAFMKLQVSYDNVLGPSFEAGLGWGFEPN